MNALEKMNESYNVVGFNNDTVYSTINLFLEKKGRRSQRTAASYKGHIKQFFMFTCNKDLEYLNWDDVLKITYQHTSLFQKYLLDGEKNSNETVNTKIAAVKSLFKEFSRINDEVNTKVVDIEPLEVHSINPNSWGTLTESEVQELIVLAGSEFHKHLTQKTFFKVAFVTAIRTGTLLKLTWNNLYQKKDIKTGNSVWCIIVKDKTKEDVTPISDELYADIIELKAKESESERIFDIDKRTLMKTLNKFIKINGLEDRNIVLHSLKKASMDYVYAATGHDIVKTSSHGHHQGIEMSYRNYLGRGVTLEDKPSYNLFDKEIDLSTLKNLSKEQLIDIINKCSIGTKTEIVKLASK